ncbi:MAG TPA: hypothetical protein VMZ50_06710, partial [Phycisphaerae bacterium]|nr:hypothetical protein [Phycisphaerae bacterium]
MAFLPESSNAAREGRRVRLYAAPRWIRLDGETWRAIEEVVSICRDASTGQYRVTCGEDWITWTPRNRPAGLLKEAVVRERRFGDVLNAGQLVDLTLEYDVRFSGGVEVAVAGWRFANVHDAEVGLFVHDLIGRFGVGRVSVLPGSVAIDVSAALGSEVNLDPTIVATASCDHGYTSPEYATIADA